MKWLSGVAPQGDATAQPATREVQHVVDHRAHPDDGRLQHRGDPVLLLALYRPIEDTGAGANRGERIAQIVTENGDELFAKPRRLIFQPQHLLRGLFRRHGQILGRQKLRFVPAPVGRLNQRDADAQRVPVRIAALIGVRDDLQRIARGRKHVDRELVEETLHPE
ncbi:hypothetical protein ABIB87_001296 [Bradyrhizobium sp. JR18.2]